MQAEEKALHAVVQAKAVLAAVNANAACVVNNKNRAHTSMATAIPPDNQKLLHAQFPSRVDHRNGLDDTVVHAARW